DQDVALRIARDLETRGVALRGNRRNRRGRFCQRPGRVIASMAIIETGPIPAVHGVVRWCLVDLCQWLWEEFRVSIARQTLGRELCILSYQTLSARPRHHA